jgi:mRNA-degrading endonuclease RelE of RelBE toxin-antitoxin system
LPKLPETECIEKTEERVENIETLIRRMEESSDTESECESAEQLQVDESYKSNSDLKKITKNAHKSKRAVKNLEDVKQKLSEGVNPMEIGYKPTNLGNGFYYIRKPAARIIVKVDPTTGNSDIVAFGLRSNDKNMETLATVVNSQCDTKIKINPKAY